MMKISNKVKQLSAYIFAESCFFIKCLAAIVASPDLCKSLYTRFYYAILQECFANTIKMRYTIKKYLN